MQKNIENYYDDLEKLYSVKSGGQARAKSGKLYENLVDSLCKENGITSKKNDYIESSVIEGLSLSHLQVDRHLYRNNIMFAAIECKTYLDLSMLKRAISDFIEIDFALEQKNMHNVKYAIFMGQNACNDSNLDYYKHYFEKKTQKSVSFFIVNSKQKRKSTIGIYDKKYSNVFDLDLSVLDAFCKWLN
jgi:hypothetical protein